MERIKDVVYDLRQLIREVKYDKSLAKYSWVAEDLERLVADIEAQREAQSEMYDL